MPDMRVSGPVASTSSRCVGRAVPVHRTLTPSLPFSVRQSVCSNTRNQMHRAQRSQKGSLPSCKPGGRAVQHHQQLRSSRTSISSSSVSKQFGRRAGCQIALATARRGHTLILAAALVDEQEDVQTNLESLLQRRFEQNSQLVTGELENGLRYVILPNKVPPKRFEAHLEIHAGSVDEEAHEQGMAHLVEHITFLGSKQREGLLGTGARSNAYTDFHHTVFHVHSPEVNTSSREETPMLPQVLDALADIAFEPEFLHSRIEKERRAVTAEAQMMNTIEYRVDCQLLQYLHEENALGCRFPIGKTEQVEQWDRDTLINFWKKWYFPANATLYVVGDFDRPVAEVEKLIYKSFGHIAKDLGAVSGAASSGREAALSLPPSLTSPQVGSTKERHEVRPPVEHHYGCGPLQPGENPASVKVFQHRLLQHFMLSIFCKLPVRKLSTIADLRHSFMVRILLSVLTFRINRRYVTADPPFISIDLDHSDSGREGCTVSTLTISSEPKDWRGAVQVAVQEMRRLQRYGVTPGELEQYRAALLRDNAQAAQQADSIPSHDNLDFVMESLALGHTIVDHRRSNELVMQVADTVTLDEVNSIARSLLSFASHYRREEEALAEAAADPETWAPPGPTRATSIVACLPAFTDTSGLSTGGAVPMHRGSSIMPDKHVDPAAPIQLPEDEVDNDDVPPGAVRFELSATEIEDAIAAPSLEVEAPVDIDVPDCLISEEHITQLMAERQPEFVPVDGLPQGTSVLASADPITGVVQRRLSNGIKINFMKSDNEPQAAMLRMVAAGGRSREGEGPGPSGTGAISVGVRTLSESGTVGPWRRDQVELFCISKLINCLLDADEEFVFMDCHFAVGDGGLKSVLELVHLFVEAPRWEEGAMERAKQMYLSHYRALSKGLERASAGRVMAAMLGPDKRFQDANPEEIEALTLEGMRDAVMAQLQPSNIEINIVGDLDVAELDELAPKYLGTIKGVPPVPQPPQRPIKIQDPPLEIRRQRWHLKDSDERSCAYIAGPAPCRWGPFDQQDAILKPPAFILTPALMPPNADAKKLEAQKRIRQAHPLYADVTLRLLTEVINSRLFTTVRDALGLTYDVSFELSQFDRLRISWFVVHVTSTPAKVDQALDASLRVLRNIQTQQISPRELLRARRTVLTRHESEMKENLYQLGLLTHLQCPDVPLKSARVLRDLKLMYEVAQVDDLQDAYRELKLDDANVFTCMGTSGPNTPEFLLPRSTVDPHQWTPGGPETSNGAGSTPFSTPSKADADAVLQAFDLSLKLGEVTSVLKSITQRKQETEREE
eukprot:jgi/Botrbrau1/16810/Bobra.150_2s0037.1